MGVQFVNGTDNVIECDWYRALDIGYLYRRESDGAAIPILDYRAYRTSGNRRVQFIGRGLIEYGDDKNYSGSGAGVTDSTQAANGFISEITTGVSQFLFYSTTDTIILSIQEVKFVSGTAGDTLQIGTFIGDNEQNPYTAAFIPQFLVGNSVGYNTPSLYLFNAVPSGATPRLSITLQLGEVYEFSSSSMFLIGPGSVVGAGATANFVGESFYIGSPSHASKVRISGRAYKVPGASN